MLKNIVAKQWLGAMAHITGSGIPGNLPRVLDNTQTMGWLSRFFLNVLPF